MVGALTLWVGASSCPLPCGYYEGVKPEVEMSINDLYDDALWMKDRACTLEDAEIFFPEPSPWMLSEIAAAKEVCSTCPVQEACLEYAIENRIEYGVWGGKTRNQRLDITRKPRRTPV